MGLIKTLIDRANKIKNTWLGFHGEIIKLMDILKKKIFPAHLIEKVIDHYIILDPKQSLSPRFPFHHLTYILL